MCILSEVQVVFQSQGLSIQCPGVVEHPHLVAAPFVPVGVLLPQH